MTSSGELGSEGGREALSVSAAVGLAKTALEDVVVRLVGEVSELSAKAGYKAVYFTVKDRSAALPCMMWNNRYQASGVELRVGALVELTGRFTLYAAKGRMNFDVFGVALAGEGRLRMQVAELARRLEAEGLMAPERKRALPRYPRAIGLVTSPRGAAVHDVLRTLRRRYPMARVLLAGVPVEGAQAPAQLAEGLRRVAGAGAEVVLLVRGGGSFEDLMPFNDEGLARAVAACPVPVVTGIGHEPDTSIADMVADLRASTPTAAAAAVAPDTGALRQRVEALGAALHGAQRLRLAADRRRLDALAHLPLFSEPMRLVEADAQALDDCARRLASALPQALAADRHRVERLADSLGRLLAQATVRPGQRIALAREGLGRAGATLLGPFERSLAVQAARLHDLSPLALLGRGWAIARSREGAVVASVGAVAVGDPLELTVADGRIACDVAAIERIETVIEPWEERP